MPRPDDLHRDALCGGALCFPQPMEALAVIAAPILAALTMLTGPAAQTGPPKVMCLPLDPGSYAIPLPPDTVGIAMAIGPQGICFVPVPQPQEAPQ